MITHYTLLTHLTTNLQAKTDKACKFYVFKYVCGLQLMYKSTLELSQCERFIKHHPLLFQRSALLIGFGTSCTKRWISITIHSQSLPLIQHRFLPLQKSKVLSKGNTLTLLLLLTTIMNISNCLYPWLFICALLHFLVSTTVLVHILTKRIRIISFLSVSIVTRD